jgi:hypothetical protein
MVVTLCLSLPGYCQTNIKGTPTDRAAEITIVLNNIPANTVVLNIDDLILGTKSVCQPLRKSKNTLFFRIQDPDLCLVTVRTLFGGLQKYAIAVAPNDKLKITFDKKHSSSIKIEGRNARLASDLCDLTQMVSLWDYEMRMAKKYKNMQQFKLYMDSVRSQLFSYIDRGTKNKTLSVSSRPALTELVDLYYDYSLLLKLRDNSLSDANNRRGSMPSSPLLNPPFMLKDRMPFAAAAYVDAMIGFITDWCISDIGRIDSTKTDILLAPKFVDAVGKLKASKFMRDVLKSRWCYYCKNILQRPVDFDALIRSIETPEILSRLQDNRDKDAGK